MKVRKINPRPKFLEDPGDEWSKSERKAIAPEVIANVYTGGKGLSATEKHAKGLQELSAALACFSGFSHSNKEPRRKNVVNMLRQALRGFDPIGRRKVKRGARTGEVEQAPGFEHWYGTFGAAGLFLQATSRPDFFNDPGKSWDEEERNELAEYLCAQRCKFLLIIASWVLSSTAWTNEQRGEAIQDVLIKKFQGFCNWFRPQWGALESSFVTIFKWGLSTWGRDHADDSDIPWEDLENIHHLMAEDSAPDSPLFEALHACLAELDPADREAVEAHYLGRERWREVADELGGRNEVAWRGRVFHNILPHLAACITRRMRS